MLTGRFTKYSLKSIQRRLFISRITIILLLGCFTTTASAKIYKWVDHQGNTHFSDKPPQDKTIKTQQQDLDNMNIIKMPRPIETEPLSTEQCQNAINNFDNNYQAHRKLIEKQLNSGQINDMQFADKLTELEALKHKITVENCHKADPNLNTLLHCMAKNPNTQVCSS